MLKNFFSKFSFMLLTLIFLKESYQYSIPTPKLEILTPKGFRMFIPDEQGIKLFGFHGAINRELIGIQPGDFDEDIFKVKDGAWIYENKNNFLNPGDTLYYWIHVQHNDHGYRLLDRSIFIPFDSFIDSSTTTTEPEISTTIFSDAERLQLVDERLNLIKTIGVNYNKEECVLSKTTVNGNKVCSNSLIFEENFDYFNWTKWQRVVQIPSDNDDAEFVSYQDYPENCYINNGELHIAPSLLKDTSGYNEEIVRNGFMNLGARCTSTVDIDVTCKREAAFSRVLPPIVSAKLRTKNFFSFRYGQIDMRVKLPTGDWVFPQLLLQPLNNDYGNIGYASGQLRVAFIRSNYFLRTSNNEDIDGRKLYGGAILTTGEKFRNTWLKSKTQNEHFGRSYHTYTMVWDDDSITLALNGKAYATFQNGFKDINKSYNISHAEKWEFGDKMAPFDKEFFLEIGVSAGGISDFPDGSRSGDQHKLKPWQNLSPKAELNFWNDINTWYPSWKTENSEMIVDRIRVWAL